MTTLVELERTGSTGALARCTGDAMAFLEQVWGRRALLSRAAAPEGFGDLLSLDDVDRLLSSASLRTPAFRLVKAGEQIPEASYTRSGTTGSRPVSGMADPPRLFALFRQGATIVLQGLHRYHEPVARFTRALELELGHPCQVNAYITPPGAQGLALHDDPHDVFVLQAFGRKAWEVHAAPGEGARDPVRSLVESGDAIYMPRGTPHAASTQETLSGHLTVGVHVTTWRQLLARAWQRVGDHVSLDDDVPAGWVRDPEPFAAELSRRVMMVASAFGGIDTTELVERETIRFLSTRPSLLRGALVDELEAELIDDETVLRRRDGAFCELRTRGDRVLLLLGDRRLELPVWLEPALRRIAVEPSFRLGDLAPEIGDPASRAVLARRLVREGLLRPSG